MPSWKPLDASKSEIRLLELSSRDSNPFITCHLITVDLQDEPEYEALSYVWGSISDDSKEVYLDGLAHLVTKNLHDALITLRWQDKTRTLWVDALCIDQADHRERSHQVAMMGPIYAKASRVLVWLSDESSPCDSRDKFDKKFRILYRKYRSTVYPELKEDPELSDFLGRRGAWWCRAWTFQEAVLGRQLIFHVGEETFTDDDLFIISCSMSKDIDTAAGRIGNSMNRLRNDRWKFRNFGKIRLLNLFIGNQHRTATDPRDRFYAYVGLGSDVPPDFIRYDLSLKDWTVYTTAKLIQHNRSLGLLGRAASAGFQMPRLTSPNGNQTPSERHLPSWCPDWTQMILGPKLKTLYWVPGTGPAERSNAGGRTTRPVSLYPPDLPDSMNVSGIHCGKIALVGDMNKSNHGPDLSCWHLTEVPMSSPPQVHHAKFSMCKRGIYRKRHDCTDGSYFASGGYDLMTDREDAGDRDADHRICTLLRVPSEYANHIADEKNIEYDNTLDAINPRQGASEEVTAISTRSTSDGSLTFFVDTWMGEPFDSDVKRRVCEIHARESLYDNAELHHIARMLASIILGRRPVITDKGYSGWAHVDAEVGDTVAVFYGAALPFILRKPEESKMEAGKEMAEYTLVGEAYIGGLMDGEALKVVEEGKLQEQIFSLR